MKPTILVGGQAVIEGVMMRVPGGYATSARDPEGKIHTIRKNFKSLSERSIFWRKPILRGMAGLYESMKMGMETLQWSADIAIPDEKDKPKNKLVDLLSSLFAICLAITLFMIVYYKISGLFTTLTIISCLALLFALMSLINTTLTLPGVIGIVLTIGMCVDANVLIFERIRENFKNNSENPKSEGFNAAYVTILDSNLTTLFAAVFLFAFGFGPIRGFSISLIII